MLSFFFFNDTATTEIYTFPYTTLFRSAITAIHPIAGPTAGGTPVILTGSGFTSAAPSGAVQFGSTAANYTVNSDTQITADRKSTRLNSSHSQISYAVFCLKKKI